RHMEALETGMLARLGIADPYAPRPYTGPGKAAETPRHACRFRYEIRSCSERLHLPPDRTRGRPRCRDPRAATAAGRNRRAACPGVKGVAQGFRHAREPRRGDRGERTRDPGFELARASEAGEPSDFRRA